METLPNEIYYTLFGFFSANTFQNAMLVNKQFNEFTCDQSIWKCVYKNTIPSKFISWGKSDFRQLLKENLSILKHTRWFQRQMFLEFVNMKITPNPFAMIDTQVLTNEFYKYSNGKFDTLPSGWYWEPLTNMEPNQREKLIKLAKSSECVKLVNDNLYLNWDFPKDDKIIHGFQINEELKDECLCIIKQ